MAKAKKSIFEINITFGDVPLIQKAIFAKNLAIMLKSGLDIVEALEITSDQATGQFRVILLDILASIQAGNSLSGALKKYPKVFSKLFINTTMAGESAGNLADNLDSIAGYLRRNNDLITKIKSAMVYPMILVTGAVILGFVLSFAVLPKIIPMFESLNVELPLMTRMLISFTKFLQTHQFSTLFGSIGTIVFFIILLSREFIKPYTHYLILKIPIISTIAINSNLANYCNTLGTLLKSGLIIDEALMISKEVVSNYHFKKCLDDISARTLQGSKLSDNMQRYNKIFPKMVIGMVRVGERSGNLENSLFHLGEFYETEVDVATKSLSVAIEPILLVCIGVIVGGLAISIITPIYKMTGSVMK